MSEDMNMWNGIGRATKDSVVTVTGGGLTICKFSIAVNGYKADEVSFFNCVMFGKFAEGVGKYITQGKRMAIGAKLKQDKWIDKATGQNRYSVSLMVSTLQLLDGGTSSPSQQANNKPMFEAVHTEFDEDVVF